MVRGAAQRFVLPFAQVEGCPLYFEDRGGGPPLVLLHGINASSRMWGPQIEFFSTTNRVIACDLPAHGRSGQEARASLSALAADVAGLLDQLGLQRAVLCGLSFGSAVAQRFALDYPDRCVALALADTFCTLRGGRSFQAWSLWVGTCLNLVLHRLYTRLPAQVLDAVAWVTWGRWPTVYEYVLRERRETHLGRSGRYWQLLSAFDQCAELPHISCPTLVLAGSNWSPMVFLTRRVAAAIPGARFVLIPDARDPSNLCQPKLFNRLLRDFLQEVGWFGLSG